MAHARRSLRNHHGKPHEHAPGDPFGVYLPPLSEWRVTETGAREWVHPRLGWLFRVMKHSGNVFTDGDARNVVDGPDYSGPDAYGGVVFRGSAKKPVYDQIKAWYATQTPATIMRLHEARKYGSERQFAIVDLDRYAGVVDTGHRYYDVSGKGAFAQYVAEERPSELVRNTRFAVPARRSERNPDWSAIRAKASHYGSRAATGAREAYAYAAPRARRAAEVTWEGAKATGRAVKRGAKRAAPVVARGARSAADRMERWSQTNGRDGLSFPRESVSYGKVLVDRITFDKGNVGEYVWIAQRDSHGRSTERRVPVWKVTPRHVVLDVLHSGISVPSVPADGYGYRQLKISRATGKVVNATENLTVLDP